MFFQSPATRAISKRENFICRWQRLISRSAVCHLLHWEFGRIHLSASLKQLQLFMTVLLGGPEVMMANTCVLGKMREQGTLVSSTIVLTDGDRSGHRGVLKFRSTEHTLFHGCFSVSLCCEVTVSCNAKCGREAWPPSLRLGLVFCSFAYCKTLPGPFCPNSSLLSILPDFSVSRVLLHHLLPLLTCMWTSWSPLPLNLLVDNWTHVPEHFTPSPALSRGSTPHAP